MHTNVYAVYVRGCSLSVTCQAAMVKGAGTTPMQMPKLQPM